MTQKEILSEVQDIFRDILDNEEINLAEETTAENVEEWDSLSHIQLVVAIEKHFGVKFTSKEILKWNNVGDLVCSIEEKLN